MSEAILLAFWIGTTLFFICREIKAKDNRESHEWWISDLRDCLHSIENEFSRRCCMVAEQYNYSSYSTQITALKNEYINELQNKAVGRMGKYHLTNLPDYIVKEYERNISRIADIYYSLGNILQDKLH